MLEAAMEEEMLESSGNALVIPSTLPLLRQERLYMSCHPREKVVTGNRIFPRLSRGGLGATLGEEGRH